MNKRKRVTFDTSVVEHPLEPVSDEEEVEIAGEGVEQLQNSPVQHIYKPDSPCETCRWCFS